MNHTSNLFQQKRCCVIFVGGSAANTPKVSLVYNSLLKVFSEVHLLTLCKDGYSTGDSYSYNSTSSIMKVVNYFLSLFKMFVQLASKRPDIVYVINPYAGILGLSYRAIFGKAYIYESLEIFLGTKSKLFQGWRRYIFYQYEKLLARNASFFIATDQFRETFLRRIYGLSRDKCGFLYNTYVFEDEARPSSPSRNGPVLSYCGLLMPGRGIEDIIRAYQQSAVKGTLWLVGGWKSETYYQSLKSLAAELDIEDRVLFFGQVSNNDLKRHMSASDLTFAFYKRDCTNNRICSPNKFFDAIGSKTSLVSTDCFLARYLLREGVSIHPIKELSSKHISLAITSLLYKRRPHGSSGTSIFSWAHEETRLFGYMIMALNPVLNKAQR